MTTSGDDPPDWEPAGDAHLLLKGDLFLTSRRDPPDVHGVLWLEMRHPSDSLDRLF